MSFKLVFLVFLMIPCAYVFGQETAMNNAEITSFKKTLSEAAQFKTLQADFTQFKKIGFVDKEIISSGKLYIVHPNKMSWQYTSPNQYSLIFKSNKIFINDQGKKNTIDIGRNKQFERISKLISTGFSGGFAAGNDYAIAYHKTPIANIVRMVPKTKDVQQYIKQVDIHFDRKDNQIFQIKLIEQGDNFTRFELKNRKINAAINDQVFAH